MSKAWWQLLAGVALAINAALVLVITYFGLAYGSNLRKLESVGDVCFPKTNFDSIRAAQMIGRLDLITFLLTAGGILFALFAFMGFWMIRREALDKAHEVAAEEARRIAQDIYREEKRTPEGDKRGTESYIDKTVPLDVKDVSTEGAVEESAAPAPKKNAAAPKKKAAAPAKKTGETKAK